MTVIFLLGIPGLTQGQYLLDTFQDDIVGNPPNGPEIGSGTYAGSTGTHSVINLGSGNYGLRSTDTGGGSLSVSYLPVASADIMQVDFIMRIESGAVLSGSNAFTQGLSFSTTSATINILLYWGNNLELRVRTLSTPHSIDKTIIQGTK